MTYKFRGKRKDNDKWAIGSLITWPDGDMEICVLDSKEEHNKFMVRPETVGMILELKDKSHKNISQGDILLRTQYIGGNWIDRKFERFEVAYNPSIAGFEYKPMDGKEYKQYTVRPFGGEEIEIIGNIHEVKPAVQDSVLNTMTTDPNVKEEEVKAPATETEQEQVPGEATQEETEG